MLTIEVLRVIWWLLMGILFMGFAITDGFDFGAAILLPFIARNDAERRIVLNAIGPFWEGNQVWIILGAGAILAAWPFVYAAAFSGFYLIILLLLLTMGISRPVSFKYRSKLPNQTWRHFWDAMVFVGGLFPSIIFGILIGNALIGVPFYLDETLRLYYTGSAWGLLQPFPLLCGLASFAMLTMHGGLFMAIKTENPIRRRAYRWSQAMAVLLIILFAWGGLWVTYHLSGYQIVSGADPMGFSNPLHKQVTVKLGAWVLNYSRYPLGMLLPALGFLGALGVILAAPWGQSRIAFLCSSLSMMGIIATVGFSMFPFILPSSIHMTSSLLVWDASSARLTLLLMLGATIVFVPIILIYTSWVYYALRGKVSVTSVDNNKQAY